MNAHFPQRPRRSLLLRSAVLAALVALTACAGYAPPRDLQAGAPEASVVASMGAPTLRLPLPDGSGHRLVFARGPMGKHTYMVDVDRDARVRRWQQVLGEEQFERLPRGMNSDELLLTLGPPAERQRMGWTPTELWSYRYPNNDCKWYQVELDLQGIVLGGIYSDDPICPKPTPSWD